MLVDCTHPHDKRSVRCAACAYIAKRRSLSERFWSHVEKTDTCWLWRGTINPHSHYGYWTITWKKTMPAHRWAYEELVGPIPQGMQLDHLCFVRICVRPDHLEPVSATVNNHRMMAQHGIGIAATHCKNGHPFDLFNTYIETKANGKKARHCRICRAAQMADFKDRHSSP